MKSRYWQKLSMECANHFPLHYPGWEKKKYWSKVIDIVILKGFSSFYSKAISKPPTFYFCCACISQRMRETPQPLGIMNKLKPSDF